MKQFGPIGVIESLHICRRVFLAHLMLLLDSELHNAIVGNLMNSIEALLTNYFLYH